MGPEVFIVLGIAVLLFGSARLPKLARSFGEAKNEFERGRDTPAAPTPVPVTMKKEITHDD